MGGAAPNRWNYRPKWVARKVTPPVNLTPLTWGSPTIWQRPLPLGRYPGYSYIYLAFSGRHMLSCWRTVQNIYVKFTGLCFKYCLRFWSGLVFYKVHCDSAVKGRVKTILRCIAKHCGHNTKELNTSNSQSKTNPSFRTLKTVCIILMAYRGSNWPCSGDTCWSKLCKYQESTAIACTLPSKSLETPLAKCGFGRYQHKSLSFFGANTLK